MVLDLVQTPEGHLCLASSAPLLAAVVVAASRQHTPHDPHLLSLLLCCLVHTAEYVDVVHDGMTGIRTTGSSMDLGSSGRGPGSVAGSLSGFTTFRHSFSGLGASPQTLGTSPRSPLGPGLAARIAAGRSVSAPAAAAPQLAAAPEGVQERSVAAASAAAAIVSAPMTPQPAAAAAATLSRLGAAARPSSAPQVTAVEAGQPGLAPAMAAVAATDAAASRTGSRSSSDADDCGASSSSQQGLSRDVSSFRVRLSSESSGMGTLSEEHEDEPADVGPDQTAPTAAPGDAGTPDMIDLA